MGCGVDMASLENTEMASVARADERVERVQKMRKRCAWRRQKNV